MPHGQATKRRSMNSVSEATPTKVPAHLSTSPSSQTTGISNELGAQIQLQAPLQGTENWKDVPPAIRAAIVQSVQDKFEVKGYDESPLTREVIDTKAIHLFKGWRYHMNQHYKALGKAGTDPYSNPFVGVSEIDWRYMIDHVFLGDTHKRTYSRCIKGTKGKIFCFAIVLSSCADMLQSVQVFWETFCYLVEKMDQLHEKVSQSGAASQPRATLLTQEKISIQVLGKRSRYLKGFRVGPKSSSTFKSTARSQAHYEEVKGLKQEVASLKWIIQSYEGRSEQFKHFMRQM
ncbi:hypothetical protein TEA_001374 [Camellia sinensis var. sinensis]|uniref:Uncharacterized protein n=1 Tax=Camellia sinensis var. sinensis TaxID=542762 RepID=A0A4S4DE66_CAMSN|nr:hypothetical protein TEA_001374 [Camellia sinensis var. sinensis]